MTTASTAVSNHAAAAATIVSGLLSTHPGGAAPELSLLRGGAVVSAVTLPSTVAAPVQLSPLSLVSPHQNKPQIPFCLSPNFLLPPSNSSPKVQHQRPSSLIKTRSLSLSLPLTAKISSLFFFFYRRSPNSLSVSLGFGVERKWCNL